jgi:hypothetical protein
LDPGRELNRPLWSSTGYNLTMSVMKRPRPVGEFRGRKIYSLAQVQAYRKGNGVSQQDVADRIRTSQAYVSLVERSRDETVQEKTILEMLIAIESIAAERERLAAEGVAELRAILKAVRA